MSNKREVIFDMPSTYGEYRVVCRYGYDSFVNYAWWSHLQKKEMYRKFFWSKPKERWVEVERGWHDKTPTSIDQLKEWATKFYDENIELRPRLLKQAMELK